MAGAVAWSAVVSAQPDAGRLPSPPGTEPRNDDIVVEGRRRGTTRTIEGTVHDVRDNPAAGAGSAADMLNTIPSVNVSPDGAVTVRGNGNVQVYIDGRPSAALSGENLAASLQSMAGGSIASAEVITNPSARFDSNGGAIINLVLNRARDDGLSGTVTANAGDHRRANAAFNGTYREAELSASLSASLRDDVRFTHIFDVRRRLSASGSETGRSVSRSRYTPTHARSANVRASIGYQPTDATELGADLVVTAGSPTNRVDERRLDYRADGEPLSVQNRVRGGTYVQNSSEISAYYQRRGSPTSASLKLAVQHGTTGLRSNRTFSTTRLFPVPDRTFERVLNRTESRTDRLALDYERPMGRALRLSVGSEWKRERNRYHNQRDLEEGSRDTAVDPVAPSLFEGVQRTAAGYVTLQALSGSWTLQVGARMEQIAIDTGLSADAVRRLRHLSGVNQSAAIARTFGDDQMVVRYSRTLQRIDTRDLNPAIVYIDAQNWRAGNPSLLPQRVTAIEAEYAFHRGSIDGSATLYYRRTDDTIAPRSEFLDDNVLLTTARNGGRSHSAGIEATASHGIGDGLRYSLTGNLFRADLSALDPSGLVDASSLSWSLQGSLDWAVTPADRLRLDGNVQGPGLVPQGRRSGTGALNLVWRHTLSPDLSLSLTAQGILLDTRVRTSIRTAAAIQLVERQSGGRAFLVGLSWKIR
ncbi:TonB-dependent receptor [Sphingosinicella terrae]|uniref:TonB-dependent receptor n=1 Tax=Sphingosinicella terrae TaxID=2172047 RepID=UPI000E0D548E|nr:TonB-dependent receptor [Sphingosinicella terrae]